MRLGFLRYGRVPLSLLRGGPNAFHDEYLQLGPKVFCQVSFSVNTRWLVLGKKT